MSARDQRPAFGDDDAASLAEAVSTLLADRTPADGFSEITADWANVPTAAEIMAQI